MGIILCVGALLISGMVLLMVFIGYGSLEAERHQSAALKTPQTLRAVESHFFSDEERGTALPYASAVQVSMPGPSSSGSELVALRVESFLGHELAVARKFLERPAADTLYHCADAA